MELNKIRYAGCVVVGYIFTFLYEMFFHGKVLVPTYEETPQLWRPHESMEEFFPLMAVFGITFVIVLAYLFTRNYEGKGIGEGLRFGTYTGFLFGIWAASFYCWMPISAELAGAWFGVTFLELLGLGVIFSLIYRK